MPKDQLDNETKQNIQQFIDSLFLDVQGAGILNNMSEEYVLKLVTRFVVSVGTAFWSISELLDYLRTRRAFREFVTQ